MRQGGYPRTRAWTLARLGITAILASFLGIPNVAAAKPTPPNVVVIVADDLGFADISANAPARIPTPHIDALAKRGVRFVNGYSTAPVCSPSRAAMLTGRYQQRSGFEYLTDSSTPEGAATTGLAASEPTLPEMLKKRGYASAAIGKWHLGSAPRFWPTRRGFDEFYGFLRGEIAHIDADAAGAISAPVAYLGDRNFKRSNEWGIMRLNSRSTAPDRVDNANRYLPEAMSEEADSFISRNRRRPFFLYLSSSLPHSPLQTTGKYWDRFPRITDKPRRIYAAMVSALDDSVGETMASLERNGVADNTIVVFVSDNGCAGYIGQGICDCSVLAGAKLGQLEGGTRVPFIVAWPGRLPSGIVERRPVSTLDIVPTVLAGSAPRHNRPPPPLQPLDGIDLVALYRPDVPAADRPLFFRMEPFSWMRQGGWKLIRDRRLEQFNQGGYGRAKNAVVISLFNLDEDPLEERDVAYENPAVVARLIDLLDKWEATLQPPAWPGTDSRYSFCGRTIDARN